MVLSNNHLLAALDVTLLRTNGLSGFSLCYQASTITKANRDYGKNAPNNVVMYISGTKALMENKKSSHRHLTKDSVLSFKDNHICIGHTASYFISLQLLFKRESRLNHNNNNTRVTVMKENKDGAHKTELMTNTLPTLNGSQTLQSLPLIGTFILEKGDKIMVIVSTPHLVYYCKGCNKITVMVGHDVN